MLYELKKIRKRNGDTQASAAHALNVPLGTYRNWEQCIYLPQDNAMLKRIADYFHVSIEALFGYDLIDPGTFTTEEDYDKYDFIRRPLYLEVAAGPPSWPDQADRELPAPSEILKKHPRAVFIKVDGDSMNKVLPDGCYALIDPDSTEVPDGTACCVTVNGYSATIKRVHHLSNGYMLAPDSTNPENKPIIYNYDEDGTEEVRIIGEVVWYMVPFDWEI